MSGRSVRFGAVIGIATAAVVLVGSTSATADAGAHPETAFALAGQGLLDFGPLTRTAAPDGSNAHVEVVGLASVPSLAQAGITSGLLTADARTGYSASTVADLRMAQLFSADAVKTTCENGHGKVEIGNGALLGTAVPQFPVRGQTLDLTVAKATFGEEKRNADGTITVTGIKVSVLPAGVLPTTAGRPAVTPIAHVTADEPDEGSDDSGDSGDTTEDPAPVVQPKPRTVTPSTPAAPKSTSADPAPPVVAIPIGGNALPGLPNLPLGTPTPGEPAQTITIGSATCGTGEQEPPGRTAGTGGRQSSADDQDETSADDADDAPAPEVVRADLPVTG